MKNKTMSQILSNRIESRNTNQRLDKDFNSLFGITVDEDVERVVKIPLTKLLPFNNQPFKPYSEEKLEELARSIQEQGLLNPIIVRKAADSDNYEILCGHNRVKAYEILGFSDIPSFIKDVDDDVATLILTESNLLQREKLLPSEKAKAYRMQMDALKHQGKKIDINEEINEASNSITSGQFVQKLSRDKISQNSNENGRQITRFIRLTYLISAMLDLVDEEKLPFIAGVELSYLKLEEQKAVYDFFFTEKRVKLDLKLTAKIREFSKTAEVTTEALDEFIKKEEPEYKKKTNFTIKRSHLKEYSDILPDDNELERLFLEFLKNYKKQKI
ncbi:MAG: ParB/RepB/Spo0J family partition protein [Ruminiclostridium sp.]|nr:ParB/RepB/Spo0J family partition protein [Ruminiclostridium sp.]